MQQECLELVLLLAILHRASTEDTQRPWQDERLCIFKCSFEIEQVCFELVHVSRKPDPVPTEDDDDESSPLLLHRGDGGFATSSRKVRVRDMFLNACDALAPDVRFAPYIGAREVDSDGLQLAQSVASAFLHGSVTEESMVCSCGSVNANALHISRTKITIPASLVTVVPSSTVTSRENICDASNSSPGSFRRSLRLFYAVISIEQTDDNGCAILTKTLQSFGITLEVFDLTRLYGDMTARTMLMDSQHMSVLFIPQSIASSTVVEDVRHLLNATRLACILLYDDVPLTPNQVFRKYVLEVFDCLVVDALEVEIYDVLMVRIR